MMERITAHTSSYQKVVVLRYKDSLEISQTLAFRIKFCGKSTAFRVAAKRYQ